jgi:aminopeptidase N
MPSLTQEEAAVRAGLLTVREYEVDLDLTGALERTDFAATSTVRFACAEPGATTFIELKPTAVHEVSLNGEPVDQASIVDNRIPLTGLRTDNELTVRATMAYSSSGEGLHRYVDPADGEVYLYVQSAMPWTMRSGCSPALTSRTSRRPSGCG